MRKSHHMSGRAIRGLHHHVVSTIGSSIINGELMPGDILPNEVALCGQLDVSRTAVREAVKALAAKGLVETRTKIGSRVRPRSDWNMFDADIVDWRLAGRDNVKVVTELFELRSMIEPAAAGMAAQRASAAEIAAIGVAYEEMAKAIAGDGDIIGPDFAFHRAILAAGDNDMVASVSHLIESALRASFKLSWTRGKRLDEAQGEHFAVLEGIRARDPERATAAMHHLLRNALADWRKYEATTLEGSARLAGEAAG